MGKKWFLSYCVNKERWRRQGLCIKPKYLPHFAEGRHKQMESLVHYENHPWARYCIYDLSDLSDLGTAYMKNFERHQTKWPLWNQLRWDIFMSCGILVSCIKSPCKIVVSHLRKVVQNIFSLMSHLTTAGKKTPQHISLWAFRWKWGNSGLVGDCILYSAE